MSALDFCVLHWKQKSPQGSNGNRPVAKFVWQFHDSGCLLIFTFNTFPSHARVIKEDKSAVLSLISFSPPLFSTTHPTLPHHSFYSSLFCIFMWSLFSIYKLHIFLFWLFCDGLFQHRFLASSGPKKADISQQKKCVFASPSEPVWNDRDFSLDCMTGAVGAQCPIAYCWTP